MHPHSGAAKLTLTCLHAWSQDDYAMQFPLQTCRRADALDDLPATEGLKAMVWMSPDEASPTGLWQLNACNRIFLDTCISNPCTVVWVNSQQLC